MIVDHGKEQLHFGIRVYCQPQNAPAACLFCNEAIDSRIVIEIWTVVDKAPRRRIGRICEDCLRRPKEESVLDIKENAITLRRQARGLEELASHFDGISEATLSQARTELAYLMVDVYEDDEDEVFELYEGSEVCWHLLDNELIAWMYVDGDGDSDDLVTGVPF
jgi:hypothetical protein